MSVSALSREPETKRTTTHEGQLQSKYSPFSSGTLGTHLYRNTVRSGLDWLKQQSSMLLRRKRKRPEGVLAVLNIYELPESSSLLSIENQA